MNKDFFKKLLAVFTAASLFVLLFQPFHIGDTTITQESSKNYNGYFPLEYENQFIELGFYPYAYASGNFSYALLDNGLDFVLQMFNIPIYQEHSEDIPYYVVVDYIYVQKNGLYHNVEIIYNGVQVLYDGESFPLVEFYGISNYEVQS